MQIQSQQQPDLENDLHDTCYIVCGYTNGQLSPLAEKINHISEGLLSKLYEQQDFPDKLGSNLFIPTLPHLKAKVLWVNCGEKDRLQPREYQKILQKTADTLLLSPFNSLTRIYCELTTGCHIANKNDSWKSFHAAIILAGKQYKFDQFKTDFSLRKNKNLIIESSSNNFLKQANAFLHSLTLVKNLANSPANICTPTFMADTALKISSEFNSIKTEILEEADMQKIGMNTLLSVTKGSKQPPKLICMQYQGDDKNKKPLVFIGKGITFDTGGTCIKPSPNMDEMKYDMCGAATVMGLIRAAAECDLKMNIVCLAPCVENMPGGNATRPGDIVKSLSGKTVEILNTDAEGRLILSDTLTYAEKYNPEVVIDLATLTGAVIIAFGNVAQAVMGNDQTLIDELLKASEDCNERLWQLPLWDEYNEMLKSNFADIPNIHAESGAKTIVAGCFLSQFAQKYRWAHFDIAGTAWTSGKDKGATGRPLLLLLNYLLNYNKHL